MALAVLETLALVALEVLETLAQAVLVDLEILHLVDRMICLEVLED